MSGIVGYIGERPVIPVLLDGLKRLEHQGYDSAGLVVIQPGAVYFEKTAGRIQNLEERIQGRAGNGDWAAGGYGIGHTRWATHGRPTEENAHPHCDCTGSLFVVHNGLIENHRRLRETLALQGHTFRTETDSEVIAHLLEKYMGEGDLLERAVARAARDLSGACTFAAVSTRDRDKIVTLRGGPPVWVGLGRQEFMVASDGSAVRPYADRLFRLADGEIAVLTGDRAYVIDQEEREREPRIEPLPADGELSEKGGFPHYMLKEIFEQPQAVRNTALGRVDHVSGRIVFEELEIRPAELKAVRKINLLACGTSLHAALYGKYVMEALARIPVEVDYASEFRYRHPIIGPETLTITISDSGETADTLQAAREARRRNSRLLAISQTLSSTLIGESHGVICTRPGPERAVASTKSFVSQLTILALFALHMAQLQERIFWDDACLHLERLAAVPGQIEQVLAGHAGVRQVAERLVDSRGFLYLGRGVHFPMALEGALKLKELSYVPAEAHPAGEIRHGALALIDPAITTVLLATQDARDAASMILYDKMLAGLLEVKSRDGRVVALATEGDTQVPSLADHTLFVPPTSDLLAPILEVVPLQLLAYHLADLKGCSIDQPRNLGKNVTL